MTRDEWALRYCQYQYENEPSYRRMVDPVIKAMIKQISDNVDKDILRQIMKLDSSDTGRQVLKARLNDGNYQFDLSSLQFKESEYTPLIVIGNNGSKELLRITKKGEVIAPDLESANEAGKVFVESIREYIDKYIKEKGNVGR